MSQVKEGMKAFRKANVFNPHPINSQAHREWEFGYNKAYFQNLYRVKRREGFTPVTNKYGAVVDWVKAGAKSNWASM